ncbi:glyceraldehyde dehydrogenase medium chain [Halalkalicoccus paucihalophilus]|uniref:Glyceraldehyde dehydrogenase medium chain n=1 Tax=Halalkalicoccus paucihalophilus TaxID=1008153 RepID=A0A151ABN8_9EURY|nr:xanthine dehydrogenase family protein subunit M [Halalkalicoccus paucihalophilus]KYH24787.1 glyceraldehyde dehydrogenase medium chain [Halalkalicoccus paucihalophilus]
MYTNDFEYYRADSVDDALTLLSDHAGAELVAGAHGLLPRMKTGDESPPALVDIGQLRGLDMIEEDDDGTDLSIGALATHAEIADSETVRQRASVLADAAAELGDPQVRNGGTIGGNLAHGDARSDPPAALLALDGSLEVRGLDDKRTIDATDLFEGPFETAVADDEIVTGIRIPTIDDAVSGYRKRRDPLSGYALVGVGVWLRTDGETIEEARVAVTGATTTPARLPAVEDELEGEAITEDTITAASAKAGITVDDGAFVSDVQASAEYREHLLTIDTERALYDVIDISQ